jgi:hypothetical protein
VLVIINARLGFSNWIQLSSYKWVQQLHLQNWINWSHKFAVRSDDSSCDDRWQFFRIIGKYYYVAGVSCRSTVTFVFRLDTPLWHFIYCYNIRPFKRTRNKSWKYHIQFLHNYWCSSVSYVLDYGWYTRYFLESSFISSRFTLLNFGTSYESSWNCYL